MLCGTTVVFTLATLMASLAPDYGVLLAARIVTALAHALFWSVVPATATSLFPGSRSGRVVSLLFTGSSLGIVLGIPGATWLGQQQGWRAPFGVTAAAGAVILVALAVLLPAVPREVTADQAGAAPDRRTFRLILAVTGLGVAGVFTFQTYVALFLTEGAGFAEGSVSPVLLLGGLAGLVGVQVAGRLVDRYPGPVLLVPLAALALVQLALFVLVDSKAAVLVLVVLQGLGLSTVATTVQVRVLTVAPRSRELASAGSSSMFNVGIGGGALLGGGVVDLVGVRGVALVAALLAAASAAVAVSIGRGPQRQVCPWRQAIPPPAPWAGTSRSEMQAQRRRVTCRCPAIHLFGRRAKNSGNSLADVSSAGDRHSRGNHAQVSPCSDHGRDRCCIGRARHSGACSRSRSRHRGHQRRRRTGPHRPRTLRRHVHRRGPPRRWTGRLRRITEPTRLSRSARERLLPVLP